MAEFLSDGTCHFPHPEEPLIYCQLERGHYPRTPHQSGDDQWWTVSRPEPVPHDPALVTMSRMDYYTLLGLAVGGPHYAEAKASIDKIIDRVKARNG